MTGARRGPPPLPLAITECGYAAMAFIKGGGTALKPHPKGRSRRAISVTEAGLAAMRAHERAHGSSTTGA